MNDRIDRMILNYKFCFNNSIYGIANTVRACAVRFIFHKTIFAFHFISPNSRPFPRKIKELSLSTISIYFND